MNSIVLRLSPALLAALIVTACGGGDDGPSQSTTTLKGTAATGAPVAGGQISVTCGTASPVTATTAANGTWQVDVPNATFPCIVAVTGGSLPAGVKLYGYATAATNVNVTPLTTLIGAYATKAVNGGTVTQASLDAAVTQVNALLATAGLPPLPTNPLTATFVPVAGDKYDDYLESVATTLAAQNVTLGDLATQITTTGAPAIPIKAVTIDFSDNQASVSVVQDGGVNVLQLETKQSAAFASVKSFQTGIKGNRANFGTEVFQGMKVSAFPGISFKSKDDGTGATGAGLPYLNYTVSKQCDGDPAGWANLITNTANMNPSAPDADGYRTYTADITTNSWKSTNWSNPLLAPNGTTVVLPSNSSATGASLAAFIAAYPNACIYNWPNPDAQVPNATNTPAVMLMLGSSGNLTAKKSWFKDIKVGGVILF
jgi:hypothetical protein